MDRAPLLSEDEAPSSNNNIGQQDASEDNANMDIAAMTELSEIIVDEIRNNKWGGSSPGTQIFRVSKEMLRAAGDDAYTPTFLSMGPYHHGSAAATEEMRRNEEGKLVVLGYAIEDGGPSVLEYLKDITAIEGNARMCYEGDISMERDALCKMLLLDGMQLISVLEFIGQEQEEKKAEAGDATSCWDAVAVSVQRSISNDRKNQALCCWRGQAQGTTGDCGIEISSCDIAEVVVQEGTNNKSQSLGGSEGCSAAHTNCRVKIRTIIKTMHDLMMLENQIPFFVVERIYTLRYANSPVTEYGGVRPAVTELARRAIRAILDGAPTAASDPVKDCKHLIDLCHAYLKPTFVAPQHKKPGTYGGRFRRATEYYEAGVKFRSWHAEDDTAGLRRPLLDVKFTNGVLWMALQHVDEKTDYILRNVLAYEQRYATDGAGYYVTAYVTFMSQLLGEPEDVALLSRRGIMGHLLGTNAEVCKLFQGLVQGLAFRPDDGHYLNSVGVSLQNHCRHRRHQWRAWGRRHHFGNPWLVAAWVFGATTVFCTILQTVFAVLSYFKGR